jgi:hypothetical protein
MQTGDCSCERGGRAIQPDQQHTWGHGFLWREGQQRQLQRELHITPRLDCKAEMEAGP